MNNNTNKVNNPMKVITGPDTRWSYANVWEAKSINGGTPKFSVSLIIPKSDTKTVAKVKAAIEAAYHEGERDRRVLKSKELTAFITMLKKQPLAITEWNERLWIILLDTATVQRDGSIVFRFKSGKEIIK